MTIQAWILSNLPGPHNEPPPTGALTDPDTGAVLTDPDTTAPLEDSGE